MVDLARSEQIGSIGTPALLLDKTKLEANLMRMRHRLSQWPDVVLRPHIKTSKCLTVANLASPARGPVTVSTLLEAEQLADDGFFDILYGVGISPDKLARASALAARGLNLSVVLDSVSAAEALVGSYKKTDIRLPALIEIDTDGHRSGVRPEEDVLLEIGAILHRHNLLRGVMTHAGESYNATTVEEIERYSTIEREGAVLAAKRLRQAGYRVIEVSIGSTPTVTFANNFDGITEVRAGVYMFGDLVMAGLGVCKLDDIALSVLTTVIGHRADKGWIITDGGWMSLSRDRGTQKQAIDQGYGVVCSVDGQPIGDLIVLTANQEHGAITSRTGSTVRIEDYPIGTRLRVLPNHACATAAQHGGYLVVEGDDIVDRWQRFGHW